MLNQPVMHEDHCHIHGDSFRLISWSAIFVGAFVAIGLSFLLNLFSVAIGLSAFTVTKEGAYALAIGGMIGLFIAVIVAMGVAGFASGYLGRSFCQGRNLGILYGFTTWSVALVLGAVIATHVVNYVSHYSNTVAGNAQKQMITLSEKSGNIKETENIQITSQEARSNTTSPKDYAKGAFMLFVLFFVGAISSCVGACAAMCCCKNEEELPPQLQK